MEEYEVIIGLEIHIQLDTKSKMFSGDSNADISELKHIAYSKRIPVIIEVDSAKQLHYILQNDIAADAILLDNFSPPQIKRALNWAKKNKYYNHYLFEASGGITKNNILDYVRTKVDAISIGALTHSSKSIDISFDLEIKND